MNNNRENWFQSVFLNSWRPFFWIAAVIFLVYCSTLFYNIVYLDDNVLVVGHYQFNKNLSNIFQAFNEDIFRTSLGGGSFYRPILRLSFMFDAQFSEEAVVFMSHFSNLVLHIFSACLFFLLLLKLNIKKEIALFLSLIFGVHPLTAQTVSFIAGRNDSLLAIFVFPIIMFFLDFLETKRMKYYVWHLIFFGLALFTKETAAILPFLCAAFILIFVNPKKIIADLKQCAYLLAGWGSVGIFWFLARREVLHNFIGNADYDVLLSIYRNFPALLPAIGKIILPFDLSVFPVMKDMMMIYGIISLILLAVWFILAKNKNYRLIIFGTAWFFLFISLTLIKPMDTTPEFSENRIYLPMLGFAFIFLGLGKIKFWEKFNNITQKKILLGISAALMITLSFVTIYRNKYYKDKLSFWNNAVSTSPSFAFNHNNLGAMFFLDGEKDEAEKEFNKALEINPKERMAHNNLGLVYMEKGEFDKADEEFNKELEINPYYDNAYANKGLLYYRMGKMEEAVDSWKKTLEVNPGYSQALYNLFIYYYQNQDKENAKYWAEEAQNRGIPLLPEMQKMLNPLDSIILNK
ncbi:MAG: tetratricopeptide repeat protein [Parcubacteria group bacterium]|jgi:hypothetical protein